MLSVVSVLYIDVWVGLAIRLLGLALLAGCHSRTTLALRVAGVAIRRCLALAPRVPMAPVRRFSLGYSRLARAVELQGALMSDAAVPGGLLIKLASTLGMFGTVDCECWSSYAPWPHLFPSHLWWCSGGWWPGTMAGRISS